MFQQSFSIHWRFSLALTDKFDHACEILEGLRKVNRGEVAGDEDDADSSADRCAKCHQTIPAWADEFPNCKPNGRPMTIPSKVLPSSMTVKPC